jgi:hypothetical protein
MPMFDKHDSCARLNQASGPDLSETPCISKRNTELGKRIKLFCAMESKEINIKVKGRRPSIKTKSYVISLYNFNATCFGFRSKSHHQVKLEHEIEVNHVNYVKAL